MPSINLDSEEIPPTQTPSDRQSPDQTLNVPPVQETPKKLPLAKRQLQPHNKTGLKEKPLDSPTCLQRRRIFTRQCNKDSEQ